MKKLLTISLLLLVCLQTIAQKQGKERVDSLLAELNSDRFRKTEDSNKVKLLNNLSFSIHYIDPNEGLRYGKEALALSEKLNWKKGLGLSYNSLYATYSTKSIYDTAIECCFKSLEIFKELGNIKNVATNLGNIAECYGAKSDFYTSLKYEFQELSIADSLNDATMISICQMNIGSTYMSLQNFSKAIDYFNTALIVLEKQTDQRSKAQCYINLSSCYNNLNSFDLGLTYAMKGLKIFEKLQEKIGLQNAYTTMASSYKELGNPSKSIEYEMKAIEIDKEIDYKYGLVINSLNVGMLLLQLAEDTIYHVKPDEFIPSSKTGKINKAIYYLENGARTGIEIQSLDQLARIYNLLHNAYKLTCEYDLAFEALYNYELIKDSIFNNDINLKIASLETEREKELKEKQIELNKLSEIKKRNERAMFIAGIILLMAAVFIIILNYNKLKDANKEKEALINRKDMLLKEIHHRVKNNLQVVGTLLDLQMNSVDDIQARDAMGESASRVKSISLIHQQLYQNEDITTIEFSKFSKELLYQVSSIFRSKNQNVRLTGNINETNIDIDTAIPLGLILNELMTNSFKYAFAKQDDGFIEINLSTEGFEYTLSYRDTGPGLPENFDIKTAKTLGMKLLIRLCKQIGGSLQYHKDIKMYTLKFKDVTGRKMID